MGERRESPSKLGSDVAGVPSPWAGHRHALRRDTRRIYSRERRRAGAGEGTSSEGHADARCGTAMSNDPYAYAVCDDRAACKATVRTMLDAATRDHTTLIKKYKKTKRYHGRVAHVAWYPTATKSSFLSRPLAALLRVPFLANRPPGERATLAGALPIMWRVRPHAARRQGPRGSREKVHASLRSAARAPPDNARSGLQWVCGSYRRATS